MTNGYRSKGVLFFIDMNQDYIKIGTAELAKRKGFDWMTLHHYHRTPYGVIEEYMDDLCNNDHGSHDFSMPTQTELQKWLREVCDVLVFVQPKEHHVFEYHIITNNDYIIGNDKRNDWEGILEEGLLDALVRLN